jgi:hypothetical protein
MPSKKRKRSTTLVPCKNCGCKLYPHCTVKNFFGNVVSCEECINYATGSHKDQVGPAEKAGEKPGKKAGKKED